MPLFMCVLYGCEQRLHSKRCGRRPQGMPHCAHWQALGRKPPVHQKLPDKWERLNITKNLYSKMFGAVLEMWDVREVTRAIQKLRSALRYEKKWHKAEEKYIWRDKAEVNVSFRKVEYIWMQYSEIKWGNMERCDMRENRLTVKNSLEPKRQLVFFR